MTKPLTRTQVSAGGVIFRQHEGQLQVTLICVGEDGRWQLPKGLVGPGETNDAAAVREVREETGLQGELIQPIDKIEYWYVSTERGQRVRFHKFVYFYLLRYQAGTTDDHDHEVNEARWVNWDEAETMLTFASEKKILRQAGEMLKQFPGSQAEG